MAGVGPGSLVAAFACQVGLCLLIGPLVTPPSQPAVPPPAVQVCPAVTCPAAAPCPATSPVGYPAWLFWAFVACELAVGCLIRHLVSRFRDWRNPPVVAYEEDIVLIDDDGASDGWERDAGEGLGYARPARTYALEDAW